MIFKWLEVDDNEVNKFDTNNDSIEIARKSGKLKNQKLSKLRKSKSEKLAKFKNFHKVEIYLILILQKSDQAF